MGLELNVMLQSLQQGWARPLNTSQLFCEHHSLSTGSSQVAQWVKNSPAMQEM